MKSRFPIRKLIIFNFWLTTYFFLLGLATTMASSGLNNFRKSLSDASVGALLLFINTFVNLALLLYFEKRVNISNSKLRIKFLLVSYALNLIAYIAVVFVLSIVNQTSLKYNQLISLALICILINTLIIALQHFVVIQEEKMLTDVENSKLKAANSDAVNQLLRQQIHPH
ncbi:MAG TPA: hypothetical protein VIH57_11785, partial [Bacteroidales bacterium]